MSSSIKIFVKLNTSGKTQQLKPHMIEVWIYRYKHIPNIIINFDILKRLSCKNDLILLVYTLLSTRIFTEDAAIKKKKNFMIKVLEAYDRHWNYIVSGQSKILTHIVYYKYQQRILSNDRRFVERTADVLNKKYKIMYHHCFSPIFSHKLQDEIPVNPRTLLDIF